MTAPATLVSWLALEEHAAELLREGWNHFVETQVGREIEWFTAGGIDRCRFILHDPGLPSNAFGGAFDQWLSDEQSNQPRLRDEFAEAWQPLIEAGHEVICHLGPLRWADDERDPHNTRKLDNPRFAELAVPFRTGEWLDRAFRSIAPAVAGTCGIAFEGHAELTPQHPGYHLVNLLRSMGTRCYIEPAPRIEAGDPFAHWYDSPKLVMEPTFDRDQLSSYHAHFRSAELIRALTDPASSREADANRIRQILMDGHTAAFRVFGSVGAPGIADLGVSCADLAPPVMAASAPAD
jgi:hypothetical protein